MEGFVPPELRLDEEDSEPKPEKKAWTPRERALTPSQQGRNTPKGFKPTWEKPLASTRCTGTVKNGERKGQQCDKWAMPGAIVCLSHGGHLPTVRKAAERRVNEMRAYIIGEADRAVDTLFDLLNSDGGDNIRLGAAKEILSIAGVKNEVVQLEVEHRVAASTLVNERLAALATTKDIPDSEEDVVDAEELVDEGEKEAGE